MDSFQKIRELGVHVTIISETSDRQFFAVQTRVREHLVSELAERIAERFVRSTAASYSLKDTLSFLCERIK